jgi:hypothetical protein
MQHGPAMLAAVTATIWLGGCSTPSQVSPAALSVTPDGWICDETACYPPQSPAAASLCERFPE